MPGEVELNKKLPTFRHWLNLMVARRSFSIPAPANNAQSSSNFCIIFIRGYSSPIPGRLEGRNHTRLACADYWNSTISEFSNTHPSREALCRAHLATSTATINKPRPPAIQISQAEPLSSGGLPSPRSASPALGVLVNSTTSGVAGVDFAAAWVALAWIVIEVGVLVSGRFVLVGEGAG